jgi:hypothetical protein
MGQRHWTLRRSRDKRHQSRRGLGDSALHAGSWIDNGLGGLVTPEIMEYSTTPLRGRWRLAATVDLESVGGRK